MAPEERKRLGAIHRARALAHWAKIGSKGRLKRTRGATEARWRGAGPGATHSATMKGYWTGVSPEIRKARASAAAKARWKKV